MMDKYFAFRYLMDFLADHAEVTDADMSYLPDTMKIIGENESQVIEIRVSIEKKEEEKDGN